MKLRFTHIAALFTMMVVVGFGSVAQNSEQPEERMSRKDKIEQLKIAFITKELDLSTEEAEKFWPAYNEMTNDIRKEKKARKATQAELKKNLESLSESEIQEKIESILSSEIKEAELKKKHSTKVANIIGYKKAVELLSLEQRFKRELLNKVNARKGNNGQGNRTRPNGPRGN